MSMSMIDLKSKINLDRAAVEKFVLLLTAIDIGEEIKTPLFKISKTSKSTFTFKTSETALERLIDNWTIDKSSPLDFVLGETDD